MLRRNLIEAIPEQDWAPIPYWMEGAADAAETEYTPFKSERDAVPVRIIVRRVKPSPGSQLALFATYSYHACITDRDGDTLALEADHRRHAEIENAIRDLRQRLSDRPVGVRPVLRITQSPGKPAPGQFWIGSCCRLNGNSVPKPPVVAVNFPLPGLISGETGYG